MALSSRDAVLEAAAEDGSVLGSASGELQHNREVVVLARGPERGCAGSGSAALWNDRGVVVLAAVAVDGWALGSASDELRSDPEVVVLAATTRTVKCGQFEHASDTLG